MARMGSRLKVGRFYHSDDMGNLQRSGRSGLCRCLPQCTGRIVRAHLAGLRLHLARHHFLSNDPVCGSELGWTFT